MEIGAGIGFLSAFCAKKIGSEKVFAYEANPFMIDKIKETYDLNGVNPKISNVLLSNKEDYTNFYLEKDFWSSSIVKMNENSKQIKVQTLNINDEIKEKNPSFLILDIEGGEQTLIPLIDFHNIQKIIIELHPHVIVEKQASKIISYLISKKFNLKFESIKGNVFMFKKDA